MAGSFLERTQAELKRGVLQLAVLASLRDPTYGYELLKRLDEAGMPTEEGTLYPVLRRMEKDDLLSAEWNTSGSRPRKYYRTTDRGCEVLSALVAEWAGVTRALESLLASTGESHVHDDRQQGPA